MGSILSQAGQKCYRESEKSGRETVIMAS
jgi:hypothetical protein